VANQGVLKAPVELRFSQFMVDLRDLLVEVWNDQNRHPIEVFERVLASRSLTCISILFGNLNGVKDAGPVYSILEHAAQEALPILRSNWQPRKGTRTARIIRVGSLTLQKWTIVFGRLRTRGFQESIYSSWELRSGACANECAMIHPCGPGRVRSS